jgi:hypothetical protein
VSSLKLEIAADSAKVTNRMWKKAAIYVLASVILYLLSLGPIIALCDRGIIPEPVVTTMLTPIFPLAHVPILRDAIRIYLKLWMTPESD